MPIAFPSTLLLDALPPTLWLPLAALAAVLLDHLCGELRRGHPLAGFGRLAGALERRLNRGRARALRGALAWALAVVPWVALALWGKRYDVWGWLSEVLLLYFALGGRSLAEHAGRVGAALDAGDLAAARAHVGMLVSREATALDEAGVARACVESTLENGCDAVFGALFWFVLCGGWGALLFRLANTLDALWGYRTPRFAAFGRVAARVDDALGYLPARLTALSYALFGSSRQALSCWRRQAHAWDSPNAGPVMAAGAGSLGVVLGGAAVYHGQVECRPPLGVGRPARGDDIARALALVRRSLGLWLALYVLGGVLCA